MGFDGVPPLFKMFSLLWKWCFGNYSWFLAGLGCSFVQVQAARPIPGGQ